MFKIISTDLDGTLLDDESNIPESNLEQIKRAIENGIRFAINSGRVYVALDKFEKKLGLDAPGNFGVCLNGSLVYETDTKKILRDVRLENETSAFLMKELKAFPNELLVYVKEKLYLEREGEMGLAYARRGGLTPIIVKSFDEIKESYSKILLMGKNEDLVKVEKHMRPLVTGRCNMFFSTSIFLEFTNMDANKGAALRFLAEHVGVDISETIAVGDHFNDIPMLKAAGLGVAVKNAEPEAKDAADYVTLADNNEGVFKEILEKFVFVN